MTSPSHIEWRADPYWQRRRLSPAQLSVYDIGFRHKAQTLGPMLEINEVLPSTFLPVLQKRDHLANWLAHSPQVSQPHDHQQLQRLADEYGWMNCLRCPTSGKESHMLDLLTSCRWIHISSKFPEYLHGCLIGFSDWSNGDIVSKIVTNRQLSQVITQNERFSKHGRYFSPFLETLSQGVEFQENTEETQMPLLLSIPFIDWTVSSDPPPLRFQVDPREGFQSSRTSVHRLRTLLQHFYRLEDTSDREQSQVFTNHKPWAADSLLDLKVRRWYGHHPEALNVDELWILVLDSRHIITFASNQSWKSRWPPLQIASRIAEVSFRNVRNDFFMEKTSTYSAYRHVETCLNGAVGLMHRSFWADIPLCLADRYDGYLEHVQYRLHRAPSSKLVLDLLQLQDELNIVVQIIKQQLDIAVELRNWLNRELRANSSYAGEVETFSQNAPQEARSSRVKLLPQAYWSTFRQHSSARQSDPISQLLENLNREYADLSDLRESTSNAIDRTIKLVNLRLEDHGKAILVFTVVTVLFLPLSFISSFFGMNFVDIRNTNRQQGFFWLVAGSATVGVLALSTMVAFFGSPLLERLLAWKDVRQKHKKHASKPERSSVLGAGSGIRNFEVLNAAKM